MPVSYLKLEQMNNCMIMSRTGHRSTDGVRCYKRPAPLLEYQLSEILNPPPARKQKLEASTSNSICTRNSEESSTFVQRENNDDKEAENKHERSLNETIQHRFGSGRSFTNF